MPKWKQKGDLNTGPVNAAGWSEVVFINTDNSPSPLKKFWIFKNKSGEISIEMEISEGTGEPSKNLRKEGIKLGYTSRSRYLTIEFTHNADELSKFINLIDKYNSLKEIKNKIYADLGLKKPESEITDEIKQLLDSKQFIQVFNKTKEALDQGYENIVTTVTETLEKSSTELSQDEMDKMLELYLDIPETNPFCETANQFILGFLQGFFVPPKDSKSKEELKEGGMDPARIELLELKLRFALRCGINFAETSGLIFHELCGYTGQVPENKKVLKKGDADFLITLAKEIRELQWDNEQLKTYKVKQEAAKAAESRYSSWKKWGVVETVNQETQTTESTMQNQLRNV